MTKTALAASIEEDWTPDYEGEPLDGAENILQELDGSDALSQAGYPVSRDSLAVRQSADPKVMSATFCIVTRQKDANRHGNMVQIAPGPNGRGLLTDNYNTNPVVLFDHGFGLALPIGTCRRGESLSLTLQKSKAISTCYFSQTLPDAAIIFGLVDEDILRMSSIQYLPFKAMRLSRKGETLPEGVEDCRWNGWDFTECDLMEWSIVAIGADPGAIRKSLDRGKINGYRIGQALRQGLSHYAEKPASFGIGVTLDVTPPAPVAAPAQLADTDAIQQLIRDTIAQEFGKHLAPQLQPAPPTPVDSVSQSDTFSPQVEARPALPTGEQLAETYRQMATQDALQQEVARQLPGLIQKELQSLAQPLINEQRALHERIDRVTGRPTQHV